MTTTMFGKHELAVYGDTVYLTIKRGWDELTASYSASSDYIDIKGMDYEGDTDISIPLEPFAAFMAEVAKMRAQRPTDSEGDAAT